MKLKNKLKMYEPYLNPITSEEKIEEVEQQVITIPNLEKWNECGVKPYILDDEYCLVREVRYPLKTKRGKYTFQDYLKAVDAWQNTQIEHPLSTKGYNPTDLFFFDTETTGLGGGAGNTIFLLGYAFIDQNEVIVKQHLLPDPSGEIPLYDSFLKSVDYTTLVTYNGKAFDWPQVKTRHTLIREHVPKLPSFGHFDLLHAARRLWKDELPSVKLSIVETEILGIKRKDDVPGYLAPIIYFDFVRTKTMDGMMKVMEHNEDDVLSLLNLYTHISFQLLGLDKNQSDREKLAVGKWYSSLNESRTAIDVYENVVTNLTGSKKGIGLSALASQYKKQKRTQDAVKLWQELINFGQGFEKVNACIELAKVLEHKEKNIIGALKVCNEAIKEIRLMDGQNGRKLDKLLKELEIRINRLNKKSNN